MSALIREYEADSPLWKKYPEFTHAERERMRQLGALDRQVVHELAFRDAQEVPAGAPCVYLATAGAPAAGKTTLLEQELHENPRYAGAVRTDPDVYAMRSMVHTYHDFLMSPRFAVTASSHRVAQRRAYDVARAWSNVLANEVLNAAFAGRYHIAHGTTLTGDGVPALLSGMRASGREVDLLLCYATDDVRLEAVQRRELQGNYQADPEDVRNKGRLFPTRFPVYFEHADNLTLFWRPAAAASAVRAATYAQGKRNVLDPVAFQAFVEQFDSARKTLGGQPNCPPLFGELEARFAARFKQ